MREPFKYTICAICGKKFINNLDIYSKYTLLIRPTTAAHIVVTRKVNMLKNMKLVNVMLITCRKLISNNRIV